MYIYKLTVFNSHFQINCNQWFQLKVLIILATDERRFTQMHGFYILIQNLCFICENLWLNKSKIASL